MSANSASMSISGQTSNPKFLRRFILMILFMATMVFWMIVFMHSSIGIAKTPWMAISIIWLGLSAGFGARLAFYNRNWLIRFTMATLSFVLSLIALGYLTNWRMGINPIQLWINRMGWLDYARWPDLVRSNSLLLSQLLGGILVILMALRIWWRKGATRVLSAAPSRELWTGQTGSPRRSLSTENVISPPRGGMGLKIPHRKRTSQPTALSSISEKVFFRHATKSAPAARRKKLFHRKPNLQISVYEEHRCPYCLDDVKRNDPRGVKECDVCHTLHHADCWNITGMCQVPHQNPLNT